MLVCMKRPFLNSYFHKMVINGWVWVKFLRTLPKMPRNIDVITFKKAYNQGGGYIVLNLLPRVNKCLSYFNYVVKN